MEVSMSRRVWTAAAAVAVFSLPRIASAQSGVERAVLPLPEAERAGATVIAIEGSAYVTVRDGTGTFVCLADDPGTEGFHASCYHESLEPYMARGRELRAGGIDGRESVLKRAEEIEAGSLDMPEMGLLHQLFAEAGWDGDVSTATRLTVIYVPYKTEAEVGVPTSRSPGPWLMYSGRPVAHIMIPG
jgi:hypothetical protein